MASEEKSASLDAGRITLAQPERNTVKIPMPFLVVFLTAWISIQAWELKAIIQLQQDVAVLSANKKTPLESGADAGKSNSVRNVSVNQIIKGLVRFLPSHVAADRQAGEVPGAFSLVDVDHSIEETDFCGVNLDGDPERPLRPDFLKLRQTDHGFLRHSVCLSALHRAKAWTPEGVHLVARQHYPSTLSDVHAGLFWKRLRVSGPATNAMPACTGRQEIDA